MNCVFSYMKCEWCLALRKNLKYCKRCKRVYFATRAKMCACHGDLVKMDAGPKCELNLRDEQNGIMPP